MKKVIVILFAVFFLYDNTRLAHAVAVDRDYTPVILTTIIAGTIANIGGIVMSLYSNHYFYNTVAPLGSEYRRISDDTLRQDVFNKYTDAKNMHIVYVTAASVLIGLGTASTIVGIIMGVFDMQQDPERNSNIKSQNTSNPLYSFSNVPFGNVKNTSIILNPSFIGVQIKW